MPADDEVHDRAGGGPEQAEPEQADPAVVEVLAERLKERIYATITMLSVSLGLAVIGHLSHRAAALTIAVTAAGLWLATVVADQQAHRTVHRTLARGRDLRVMFYVSSPLLLSAVAPLVMVALSALGAMQLRTALLAAVGIDVASLFGWGLVGGLRMGGGWPAAVLAGVADTVIGVAVAVVKYLAGH